MVGRVKLHIKKYLILVITYHLFQMKMGEIGVFLGKSRNTPPPHNTKYTVQWEEALGAIRECVTWKVLKHHPAQ